MCISKLAVVLTLLGALTVEAAPRGVSQQVDWLKRKELFYSTTTFPLSEDNIRLLGGHFAEIRQGHLPFWFDFELFKTVFNKRYPSAEEELARHFTYIKTCVRTLKQRVMFRILAGTQDSNITSEADQFYEEANPGSHLVDADQHDQIQLYVKCQPEVEADEHPLNKAIRLVQGELAKVESLNQLNTYLRAFEVSSTRGEPWTCLCGRRVFQK